VELGPGPEDVALGAWRVICVRQDKGGSSKGKGGNSTRAVDLVPACMAALEREVGECAAFDSWDRALIENQPGLANPGMRVVQALIHAYFALRHPAVPVSYVAASGKTRAAARCLGVELPKRVPYAEAKRLTVAAARRLLADAGAAGAEGLRTLEEHRKKDDLCDAFMQAVYHYHELPRVDGGEVVV
jgi:hypothetical protein